MAGYTKLFSSIVTSTIWQEPDNVRLVWITMLALADQDGIVGASIPGLARMAGVPLDGTEGALATLLGPDPYSRTSAHEGRRLEAIEGGWRLLNYDRYRACLSADEKRAKATARQARRRAALKDLATPPVTPVTNVTLCSAPSRQAEAEAEAEAEAVVDTHTARARVSESGENGSTATHPPRRAVPEGDLLALYAAYPKKVGKKTGLDKLRRKLRTAEDHAVALAAATEMARLWHAADLQYCPAFSTWANQERWQDEHQQGPSTSDRPNSQRDLRIGYAEPSTAQSTAHLSEGDQKL